jgi:hypothetical protein
MDIIEKAESYKDICNAKIVNNCESKGGNILSNGFTARIDLNSRLPQILLGNVLKVIHIGVHFRFKRG